MAPKARSSRRRATAPVADPPHLEVSQAESSGGMSLPILPSLYDSRSQGVLSIPALKGKLRKEIALPNKARHCNAMISRHLHHHVKLRLAVHLLQVLLKLKARGPDRSTF